VGSTHAFKYVFILTANNVTISDSLTAGTYSQGLGDAFSTAILSTGTFTLTGDLTTTAGWAYIASETISLNASMVTQAGLDDPQKLSSSDGLVALIAGAGGVSLAAGHSIVTTAATPGQASGQIAMQSAGAINLAGSLVTTGSLGVAGTGGGIGSAGGAVIFNFTGTNQSLTITDLNTDGGVAATGSGAAGGDAGALYLNLDSSTEIVLSNSTITAAGGAGDGAGSQGAGADLTFTNDVTLQGASASISTGATLGNVTFSGTLDGAQGLATHLREPGRQFSRVSSVVQQRSRASQQRARLKSTAV